MTTPRTPLTAADPHTGETLSLWQLGKRYGLNYKTVVTRYHKGKRGHELIQPPMEDKQQAALRGRSTLAGANKAQQPATAGDRRATAAQVLTDPSNHWLARPLRANA